MFTVMSLFFLGVIASNIHSFHAFGYYPNIRSQEKQRDYTVYSKFPKFH